MNCEECYLSDKLRKQNIKNEVCKNGADKNGVCKAKLIFSKKILSTFKIEISTLFAPMQCEQHLHYYNIVSVSLHWINSSKQTAGLK